MNSAYEKGYSNNIFKLLDADCSLFVLGICLASNDLVMHNSLLDKSEVAEKNYHFAALLSILREIAKMIEQIEKLAFVMYFSQGTKDLLQALKSELQPFEDDSLTKGTLKPIRDFTFHYSFAKAHQNKIDSLLEEIRKEPELEVRARSGDNSILRYRYIFADTFRNKLVTSYLTTDSTRKIAIAINNIIAFTDSLLADFSGRK